MRVLARMRASSTFVSGTILTAAILLIAALAPILAPYPPNAQRLTGGLLPPSPEHWLGTDQLGRDVLSRLLLAAQTDLGIAAAAAIAPFAIGVTVGLVSGYFGGAVDWTISRVTDTVIAFPFYVIVIALVFAVGAGAPGIVVAFALVGWVGYARVLRAMTAALRDAGWVRAARGGGLSHARVLLRHILPNVLPQAVVLLATEIVLIMVAIVTLGYLGLGIQPPTPDWGTMISDAQPFVTSHWWLAAVPGLAVVLVGVALSLLGDGIGDVLRVGAPAPRTRRGRVRGGPRDRRLRGSRGGRSGGGAPGAAHGAPGAAHDATGAAPAPGAVRVRGLRITAERPGPLVDGIDLDASPGEALGIVGESGSGKSLTLRALLGMPPGGTRVAADELSIGGRVGMVFQDPMTALDPLTRVGVQLQEAVDAGPHGGPDRGARVRELLAQVELRDAERIARSYPHELSGGQRQRIVIAMALAGDPAVLLCDEPTTALDVTVQRQVLDLLDGLRRRRGITLVLVSHDLAVVAGTCARIVVMRDGRIVESGETARVVRQARDPYTRALLDAVPVLPDPAPPRPVPGEPEGAAPVASGPVRSGAAADPAPGAAPAPSAEAPALLEARGVAVRYGERTAVADVSFALPRGGALGVVGESGSGKTSLAHALVGVLATAGGEIRLAGAPLPARRSRAQLRRIQLVPQDPASTLNPRLSVGAALGELLRAHGTGRGAADPRAAVRDRISELLGLVGLAPEIARAFPHELSGGQRQRVALARALAVSPEVLVADEPTSALDVSVQAGVVDLLRGLQRELGLGLVFVSHDLAVVHELCDRVLLMREGRVVEQAGAEFFRAPRSAYGRELLSAVPRMPRG
ncbi:ATP-binding cassette domain-containing protein [Leucobacter allii]|uniref:ABC transporter ATP-binding protein/permease n=1 Tax=Leucobacter allii TaxID=2932247 RepID=UPI001FD4CF11|nr:ATP-binding cassette domain-containing protein [Leucobacter allii]UOR00987.1 ATP-binding cassette domain-containing protein [Leucobacter allii]